MSTAAKYLTYLGVSKHQKLPDSRLQFSRRWKVENHEYARAQEMEKYLFQPWGTPDGVLTGIDAKFITTPLPKDTHSNALLTDQYFDQDRDRTEAEEGLILVKVYQTLLPNVLTPAGKAITRKGENGLLEHVEFFITRLGYDVSQLEQPGVSRGTGINNLIRGKEVYLGRVQDEDNHYAKVVEKVWAEAGILSTQPLFDHDDGLLYVTFESQGIRIVPTALNKPSRTLADEAWLAFQGGPEANLYRVRTKNVDGFRHFVTTVMMKLNGDPLENNSEVKNYTTWDSYQYPGVVNSDTTNGIVASPGSNVAVLVNVTEVLTTSSTVGASPVPFSIKRGAYVNVNFTLTATGLPESLNKSFGTNFLIGSAAIAGSSTNYLGSPVSSIAGSGSSSPSYSGFLATSTPILSRTISPKLMTDTGEQWYVIRQVQLVGTFGDYD